MKFGLLGVHLSSYSSETSADDIFLLFCLFGCMYFTCCALKKSYHIVYSLKTNKPHSPLSLLPKIRLLFMDKYYEQLLGTNAMRNSSFINYIFFYSRKTEQ
ncbi:angiotensin-converting enzyme [Platysternon megacephalum]|uniref:Angiotensin-converting enzyme n=1 Tax=Platysternon megacephalum TaxID=55544 RepID=A0A4D9EZF2_9SAUR|nr:angiotensin-converting enzyme [Platysternon megacephalum]